MTYYRQTVLIPMSKQRFPEPARQKRSGYGNVVRNDNTNRELNSILAFFD